MGDYERERDLARRYVAVFTVLTTGGVPMREAGPASSSILKTAMYQRLGKLPPLDGQDEGEK